MKKFIFNDALLVSIIITAALWLGVFVAIKPRISRNPAKYGAVIRILNQEGNALCSGTVISPTVVLTARHCVLSGKEFDSVPASQIEIRPSTNEPIGAIGRVYETKQFSDQALIKGDFHQFEFIKPSNAILRGTTYTTPVLACGYPHFKRVMCTPLIYLGMEDVAFDPDHPIYVMVMHGPVAIVPGMSGGPVFTKDGELIGVNTGLGQTTDGQIDSFISPIYDLLNEIKSIR